MPHSNPRYSEAVNTAASLLDNGYDAAYIRDKLSKKDFSHEEIDSILAQLGKSSPIISEKKKKINDTKIDTNEDVIYLTWLDVLLLIPLCLLFAFLSFFAIWSIVGQFIAWQYMGIGLSIFNFIPLVHVGAFWVTAKRLIQAMRYGLQPVTAWEKFKFWMRLRPLAVMVLGVVGLISLAFLPAINWISPDVLLNGLFVFMILWVLISFFFIIRAPRFYGKGYNSPEANERYKKRFNWVEQKEG